MVITGIIRPPPEIRTVADRTALYVSKNGRAFEQRIVNSAKGKTPKFAFLQEASPFHAYYEQRIEFYLNGGTDEKDEDKKSENKTDAKDTSQDDAAVATKQTTQQESAVKSAVLDPVAKALLAQKAKIQKARADQERAQNGDNGDSGDAIKPAGAVSIVPPPPLQFVNLVAPSNLSLAQLEVIQLVAQLTAMDGKHGPFLSQLTLREWNNPAFAFCQPRHGQFAYFSALVDAYRRVLGLWTLPSSQNARQQGDNVPTLAGNVPACLEHAAYRAAYEQDSMQQAARQKEQGEELTPAKIDWQDFVVVETIDFAVDEKVLTLPPPPSSMLSAKNAKPNAAPQQQQPDVPYNDDDDDEQIRVVPTYTPKIAGAGNQNVDQMVIDPITGKTVRVQDLPEHMRIQLLDPKWAEERKKFQDKLKDSNLVSGDMVASNLERLGYGAKRDQDLLSSSKRTYDEAELKRPAGPSFPGMPAASARSAAASLSEDTAKRARVEGAGPVYGSQPGTAQSAANAPPPPPPPPPAQPPAPPPEHPFAAAIGGASNTELANRGGDDELLSEADFAASLAKPTVTLQVRVPNDAAQMAWNFYGQIVSLAVDVMLNVKTVKQQLATTHLNGMPANKIQLKNTATGAFLKDNMSLAALNIGPSATLELTAKKRGGRK